MRNASEILHSHPISNDGGCVSKYIHEKSIRTKKMSMVMMRHRPYQNDICLIKEDGVNP